MDADLSAALAPEALAPPIAHELGLPEAAVAGVLRLLARGDQPAFLARYRLEHVGPLGIRDLERVQARALSAVAFELQRQQLKVELMASPRWNDELAELLATATHPVELEDARVGPRKRKRGPAAKARARGLGVLASHLWACGSDGRLRGDEAGDPQADPMALAEQYPGRPPRPRAPRSAAAEGAPETPPSDPSAGVDVAAEPTEPAPIVAEVPADEASEPESVAGPTAHEAPAVEAQASEPAQTEPAQVEPAQTEPAQTEPAQTETAEPETSESSDAQAVAPEPAPSPERDLAGARVIVADEAFRVPALLRGLRSLVLDHGHLHARLVPGKKDKGGRYARLAEHPQPLAKLNPGHVLGLLRGEREGALELRLAIDVDGFDALCAEVLGIDASRPCGAQLRQALREAWEGSQGKVLLQGARKMLKQRVDRRAIAEFCEAYRALLLAPALGPVPVLSIDPGFAPGCRVAVIDAAGQVAVRDSVFPLEPKLQVPQAKARLTELATAHGVAAIVVVNGNGGRDVERLCRELVRETEGLQAAVVSADAEVAGAFASSRAAKASMPDDDASMRRAVFAGRRLRDPLSELAKVDPRKLGLGPHQHEVDQEELRAALEQVLISCVNRLGVDVNTADADELSRVVGFTHALAMAVVSHREQHGPFPSRQALLDVPGVAGKTFEQAAGFLRISGGDHELDRTSIHPERYADVVEMARDVDATVGDLLGNAALVSKIEGKRYLGRPGASGEPLGRPTLEGLLDELRHPGVDPRPPFEAVEYEPSLQKFDDLEVGMELPGVVTHVANFGAFVDVGLPQEALVHVSELTHGFISSPSEAVHVGQRVKGRVIEISADRKRFSLSLRALQPRPEGRSKPDDKRRRKGEGSGRGDGRKGDRDKRGRKGDRGTGGGRGGDRDRDRDRGGKGGNDRTDRVLGFRLDLSELAKQLDKG
ncbi:MAG: helix-hairpin-helix domain-containing protein [Nannocystaceae bacterium]